MPTLVARAVRLREDLNEEVPASLIEKIQRPFGLETHARYETCHELFVVLRRSADLIARGREWMRPEPGDDSSSQTSGVRLNSEDGVVPAPLHRLNAIE